jgi:hypothetical protein
MGSSIGNLGSLQCLGQLVLVSSRIYESLFCFGQNFNRGRSGSSLWTVLAALPLAVQLGLYHNANMNQQPVLMNEDIKKSKGDTFPVGLPVSQAL